MNKLILSSINVVWKICHIFSKTTFEYILIIKYTELTPYSLNKNISFLLFNI